MRRHHRPSSLWMFRLPRNDLGKLLVVLLWWPWAALLWLMWFFTIGWIWFIVREPYEVERSPVVVVIRDRDD